MNTNLNIDPITMREECRDSPVSPLREKRGKWQRSREIQRGHMSQFPPLSRDRRSGKTLNGENAFDFRACTTKQTMIQQVC